MKRIIFSILAIITWFGCQNGSSPKAFDSEYFESQLKIADYSLKEVLVKFEEYNTVNPSKTSDYYKHATHCHEQTDELMNLLETSDDNVKIMNKIKDYKNSILNQVDDKTIVELGEYYLEMWNSILVSRNVPESVKLSIVIDLKRFETKIIQYWYSKIEENDYKFEDLQAIVWDSGNIVKLGDKYKARIIIAGRNKTSAPETKIGKYYLPIENGFAIYNGAARTKGVKKFGGIMIYRRINGDSILFPFGGEYIVE